MKLPWKLMAEWVSEGEFVAREIVRVYAQGRTRYQEYMIAELAGVGKALIIDGKVQSSTSDEHWYHEALVHPILLTHPCPQRVLVIGGGEGATVREVLKHKCVKRVVMVDIDRELIEALKRHMPEMSMGAFSDPRVELVYADGRRFLEDNTERFDAIILDLVDPTEGGPAVKLYTLQFYKLVERSLNSDGIMVTQATSPVLTPYTFAVIRNTIAKVFSIVRPYITYVRSYNGLWGFIAASDRLDPAKLAADDIAERIRERIQGQLRFYDPQTHMWMFSLPKPIRDTLQQVNSVATDENPVYVPV